MTPLSAIIAARIARDGPMRLDDYMRLCLLHPDHGYYATRDPFGAAGDFTTAPEISQIFGEIVGLALAQAWLDQGAPTPFTLAELGPGRGTLMADILRATARVPGFAEAAQVVLVEASAHLRGVQRGKLGARIRHADSAADLPQAPLFLIANEFFDALPIRQMQRVQGGWAERMVTLGPAGLAMALAPPVDLPRSAPLGEVWETCPEALPIMQAAATRIAAHGGAAIIVDYGTWDGRGDSFQALRRHAPDDPLAHPGEADLTAHVDFAPLAGAVLHMGAAASVPVGQGDWLLSLGAAQRAEALTRAGAADAAEGLSRLTDPARMGQLFKAMAVWPRGASPVPGFAPLPVRAAHYDAPATNGDAPDARATDDSLTHERDRR